MDKHPGKQTKTPPPPREALLGKLLCYACKYKKLLEWSGSIISDKEKKLEIQMESEGRILLLLIIMQQTAFSFVKRER